MSVRSQNFRSHRVIRSTETQSDRGNSKERERKCTSMYIHTIYYIHINATMLGFSSYPKPIKPPPPSAKFLGSSILRASSCSILWSDLFLFPPALALRLSTSIFAICTCSVSLSKIETIYRIFVF